MIRGSADDCQRGAGGPRSGTPGRTALRLAVPALFVVLLAAVLLSGAWRWVSLEELRDRRAALQAFVREHPVLSLELYVGAYALLISLSLPGALIMSLGGGYLFGVWRGSAAAVTGVTAGSVAMYAVARLALGGKAERPKMLQGRWVDRLERGLRENAVSALLTLRLIPGVPVALVNLAAGVFRAPFGVYLATTAAGIAPSTLVYCWVGQGLGHAFKRSGAVDPRQLVTPAVYGPMAGLVLLAAAPLAYRWARGRAAKPARRPAGHGDARAPTADGSTPARPR